MKLGSLFAGIGGFDLAAERVGMQVAWQSELDPHASRVLAHHWPDVPNLGDIHDITEPPTVDVLTGGFPCQDYSVAGNRAGLAGDRGALWWQMHRIIARLRPTWVVGENVPGLLSSRGGADFETIIRSLTELGYGVAWAVLDAQYFGVAQRRRRVFIVGHSGGVPRPEILALSEGLFGHPEPSRETGERTAAALAARTRSGGELHTEPAGDLIAFNWKAAGSKAMLSPRSTHTDALHTGQTPAIAFHDTGQGWWNQDSVAGTLRAEGENRPSRPSNVITFVQNQRGEVRDLDDLAGGLQADPGMKQQTYVTRPTVRRLTPLEAERLQGFPDHWTAVPGNSDTQRYRQLGNAVAVPVAEWILGNITKADGKEAPGE